ncbi:formate dehydrogenase accessory protein FdhE [Peristeroidobacter soli]|uniref:formate dehydrogenase accessory protein FdhE n=1 Tax=Peristeroidobacter soli TaxID=2497877 RepID=UPI00101E1FC0|nr:formate dehydrogenase accessory protein FdhE [Peristeroidobacter soli]
MQRILEPGQIETFAQRDIPRLRLPDRARVFSARAERLRRQSEAGAIGHAIRDYLHLMAHLADAQQAALESIESRPLELPGDEDIAHAQAFHMPLVSVASWQRQAQWQQALASICSSLTALPNLPAQVLLVTDHVCALTAQQLEAQADNLLAVQPLQVDTATAPFIMAALQVYWVALASRTNIDAIHELDVPGVCPTCGTLPVASIVRADSRHQGLRYLHCALCATEWHMVRVKCSHCQTTQGISYQSIEDGPRSIRAECCDTCRTYRKILYQEDDVAVEPVADDLASLSLDLLLSEAGYRRASPNPLLWQQP